MISPLLANIYLHDFDRAFHGPDGPAQFAQARLVRYADDFVVLARWMGPRLVAWLERTLEQDLRLTLNRAKTRVVEVKAPQQALDFRLHAAVLSEYALAELPLSDEPSARRDCAKSSVT